MRSGGNDFNYYKLIKLANFVQFKRMVMFCLEDWGRTWAPWAPLGYATSNSNMEIEAKCRGRVCKK